MTDTTEYMSISLKDNAWNALSLSFLIQYICTLNYIDIYITLKSMKKKITYKKERKEGRKKKSPSLWTLKFVVKVKHDPTNKITIRRTIVPQPTSPRIMQYEKQVHPLHQMSFAHKVPD